MLKTLLFQKAVRAVACHAVTFGLLAGVCAGADAQAQTRTPPQSEKQIHLSFAPVVKRVVPAVVNISGKRLVAKQQRSPLFNDPFFRRFFGNGFGRKKDVEKGPLGSGVIVRADGLIVTNNHVIAGAGEITVALVDRREFPVEIVLADKRTDLAVLKILKGDGATFPYLEMGDSDALAVGDLVLAVGNPFGFGQTVTSGIVSALARTRVGITDFRFFIQTDAAINPGNSGGALVTLNGKLVGINSAIYSKGGGGSIGIGFAVPTNMARTVVHAAEGGRLIRPWFGARGQAVTAELAPSFGLSRPGGIVINEIYPGGPADRAGIAVGDVITGIGGHEVNDPEALQYRVATQMLNARTKVSIVRQNRPQTLGLTLTPPPENPPRNKQDLTGANPFSGAQIANLSPALGEELGVGSMQSGVIVLDIGQGSSAERVGFRTGDVILRLNDRDIKRAKDLVAELSRDTSAWEISIRRGEQVLTTVFRR